MYVCILSGYITKKFQFDFVADGKYEVGMIKVAKIMVFALFKCICNN